MAAVAANSPFLFGKQLWDETRIAVFEQALPYIAAPGEQPVYRVSLGDDYLHSSYMEMFLDNLQNFPVIFPIVFDEQDQFKHVCLHNGSIWRWNRPIIGFDPADHGKPHLRIEHRVMPAGPSQADNMANVAFFLGLLTYHTNTDTAPESRLSFLTLKRNFYQAAKHSLDAEVLWLDNKKINMQQLILNEISNAVKGLQRLGAMQSQIDRHLQVIEQRVTTKQHGANWQKKYVERHGKEFSAMMSVYYQYQQQNIPVHNWRV